MTVYWFLSCFQVNKQLVKIVALYRRVFAILSLPAWQQPFLCSAVPALLQRNAAFTSDWRLKDVKRRNQLVPRSSINSASACAFKSASMRILMFVVFQYTINPFLLAIIVYAICRKQYFARIFNNKFWGGCWLYRKSFMKNNKSEPIPVWITTSTQVRRLVHECCNYIGETVSPWMGNVSVSVYFSLLCRWFRAAVLPQDKELETALFHWLNAKKCAVCGALFTSSNRANTAGMCRTRADQRKAQAQREK